MKKNNGCTKMENIINLIYIAGEVRSGTTVIDLLISNHNEIISTGELINLEDFIDKKDIGWSYNWECSCGKQVERCDYWNNIIEQYKQNNTIKITTKVRRQLSKAANTEIARNCWNLISIISKNNQKKYIVDSSKSSLQLSHLYYTKNNNRMNVIYIIRDSRAVAYSKSNWKIKLHPNKKPVFLRHIIRWLFTNISIVNFLSKYNCNHMVIRYEYFATNPNYALDSIYKNLNLQFSSNNSHSININDKHLIAGTPNKNQFLNTPIRLDHRWKHEINSKKNLIAYVFGIICNHLLNKYIRFKKIKTDDNF